MLVGINTWADKLIDPHELPDMYKKLSPGSILSDLADTKMMFQNAKQPWVFELDVPFRAIADAAVGIRIRCTVSSNS